MKLQEIKFADLSLVELDEKTNTPYCKKHGAMNKLNILEDGGGYWRCLSYITKDNDTACRAGCIQLLKDNTEG